MDASAWRVRVYPEPDDADPYPLPGPDRRRVVVTGPATPPTATVLHRVAIDVRHPGGPGFADEHLLADAGVPGPWPPIADVVVADGPLGRVAALRARCPGCLVAAFGRPDGEYLLEVAADWFARLVPLGPGTVDVWPYASFVHTWTVTGRPLDALDGGCLHDGRTGVRISVMGRPEVWRVAS